MSIELWILFWKWLLIVGVGLMGQYFARQAPGWLDAAKLVLADLKKGAK